MTTTLTTACKVFDFLQISPGQSYDFYHYLFQQGTTYGMTSFEIDFVNQILNCVPEFQSRVQTAEDVFNGMALAADHLNQTMQWCSSTPAAVLQSLNYPSVTNMRASVDYITGDSWDIGLSSLFLWAVNIAPSTDTFWTSDNGDVATIMGGCDERGGCPEDHNDSGCELHTILAVMSTGPVGFSDALNKTNAQRILRTCRADGTLLQPNKPLTTMDRHLGQPWRVLQSYSGPLCSGPTPSAPRLHAYPVVWVYYVVAHQLQVLPNYQISVELDELWPRPKLHSQWFVIWNGGGDGRQLDNTTSACLTNGAPAESCGVFVTVGSDNGSFSLPEAQGGYHATRVSLFPACPTVPNLSDPSESGWVLLGELSKYVSVSNRRFSAIECVGDDDGDGHVLKFRLKGVLGEVVTISAIYMDQVYVQPISICEDNPEGQLVSFHRTLLLMNKADGMVHK
jgi:hypothetical protein